MLNNCFKFNGRDTIYYLLGYKLAKYARNLVLKSFPDAEIIPELPEEKPLVKKGNEIIEYS